MFAMVLEHSQQPLQLKRLDIINPNDSQLLVKVSACAICRTDLHIYDGDLDNAKLPLILGHQIVGRVVSKGKKVNSITIGDRVGISWLGWSCGICKFCNTGRENLCNNAHFVGYNLDGGYAEYTIVDQKFCFIIPEIYDDISATPLLCAGLIGYRSLKMTQESENIGLYGFGSSAQIIIQVARAEGRKIFVFTRQGDIHTQNLALSLGAIWAGDFDIIPPILLDAAILFAPLGNMIPIALQVIDKGGIVVCAGIHMTDIPLFPYYLLWQEKKICSVANLTRSDGIEFLSIAPKIPIKTHTHIYPMTEANEAMFFTKHNKKIGSVVLVP